MKTDKYTQLLGQRFGQLTLVQVEEIKSESKRISHILHFECSCGTKKAFSAARVSKVLLGDTVSCGCVRKEKWRKSYYSWKKDWDERFPQ